MLAQVERRRRWRGQDRVCECCGHPLPEPAPDEILEFGDLLLDVPKLQLTVAGRPAKWCRSGCTQPLLMLAELMRWPGRVWRRDALMTTLGMWDIQPHTLAVLAYRIRSAIAPSESAQLVTVHGCGYVLEAKQ